MENTIYIAMSRHIGLFSQLDTVANNVANMDTDGYKAQRVRFQEHLRDIGTTYPLQASFTNDIATYHSMDQGALKGTGRQLDVAINGKGFFQVETPLGQRYTRAGSFALDATGNLINAQGYRVLSAGGAAVTLAPDDTKITINQEGVVSAVGPDGETAIRGQIGVVNFANLQELKKAGNGLYSSEQAAVPGVPGVDFRIAQGMLEKSNVNGIKEMTNLVKINRTAASAAQIIQDVHELERQTISTITRQQ